ncbi:MAG: MotA/TolQ/ExbB proton channel family protein [Pseudomonadales bacterium]|jgi:biopolymer transport protein ExbB|nr:MotA/TolQ/ExbB proton channel family protein [Pseudomonadales bacterium]MDP7146414.1 MotA/TolQ/ExbB proton channel family protein [Pseudomonadales bacterium]MDP7358244.1 MotA/TolQ/ExbB proton channel family protein [Pseudomonadales bacterium]MDP7597725.1 MotA/TolQ/ExbB proton channel family protein [Pseudomonadales bacterium]HJN49044.1 MotA/TolQ/ExbB proton channel family protein [Pseudomonadales bacterium]|tara:strand:+ start:887 stop:2245 length:1359 start_codon:yes stop_codon:yes gene_type:complete
MKRIFSVFLLLGMTGTALAAEEIPAKNLGELLDLVREGQVFGRDTNVQREKEFLADKTQQQQRLARAKRDQKREEDRSEKLETQFENNETKIANLQEILQKRLGSLRELFGVLQQVSGDTRGIFDGSLISAEYPGRGDWLAQFAAEMGRSTKLATIDEIERLWYELQQEMTESGKVTRFNATIIKPNGDEVQQEVVRVGTFNVISEGSYLKYDIDKQVLVELPRQPANRFVATTEALNQATSGFTQFGMDPTKGQLLSLLIQTPTLEERIQQGGNVGYVIIALAIVALLLSMERLITLYIVGGKVNAQMKQSTPDTGNPLGRVLMVHDANKDVDTETLNLRLEEAILKETPKLNARIAFIKIISMVAPLLGLLGTVVGMILTFQAITLFGTGDPKTMAGGISQALMTTVMGLCVAIPTVLLHAIVQTRSNSIIHVLNERAAGLLAEQAEEKA